jgi:hypothetical protein
MIHQRSHASRSNNCHNLLPRIMQCSSPWRHRKNWSRPISYGFLWFFYVLMFWSANFFVTFLYFSFLLDILDTTIVPRILCLCEISVKSLWNRRVFIPWTLVRKGTTVKLVESSASKPAMHVSSAQRRQCHSRSPKKGYEKPWQCPLIPLITRPTLSNTCLIFVWYLFDMFDMFDMFVSYSWCVWCMLHLFLHTPCSNTMISMIKSTTTVDAVSITRCADFPAPAVPSTRAHHHPTVILEPKERSSTNNSNRIAIE